MFKAGGLFGDFLDLGDTVLEEFEILEDADNLEISIINNTTFWSKFDHTQKQNIVSGCKKSIV